MQEGGGVKISDLISCLEVSGTDAWGGLSERERRQLRKMKRAA